MSLADRLRGIVAAVPGASERSSRAVGADGVETSARPDEGRAAEILGGEWRESGPGRYLVVERTYRPGHRHGRLTLVDHVLPDDAGWRDVLLTAPTDASASRDGGGTRTLFIDLETTGLAGGAGTYAFLVGCGWFEGGTFRVQQFFMSTYAAERALLDGLADLARSCCLIVSYNGKTFDLPLIETRFLFNRMTPPFAQVPHLDMLHAARRLWRSDDGGDVSAAGCRLSTLEQALCGHTREGDVPGFEIPARYFHYVRTGDAGPLEGVLEHNRLDILSLAFLTARAAQLVEEGPSAPRSGREAVGLGRLYERSGMTTRARACFARACGLDGTSALPGDPAARADALRSYALLCRRQRQFADAAVAWQQLAALPDCPPHVHREAIEALAIHHEHRLRDPRTARAFAIRSLPLQGSSTRRQALQHRLARLDRKLDAHSRQTATLF